MLPEDSFTDFNGHRYGFSGSGIVECTGTPGWFTGTSWSCHTIAWSENIFRNLFLAISIGVVSIQEMIMVVWASLVTAVVMMTNSATMALGGLLGAQHGLLALLSSAPAWGLTLMIMTLVLALAVVYRSIGDKRQRKHAKQAPTAFNNYQGHGHAANTGVRGSQQRRKVGGGDAHGVHVYLTDKEA